MDGRSATESKDSNDSTIAFVGLLGEGPTHVEILFSGRISTGHTRQQFNFQTNDIVERGKKNFNHESVTTVLFQKIKPGDKRNVI